MPTVCLPCAYHVPTMCLPCAYHVLTVCSLCTHHVPLTMPLLLVQDFVPNNLEMRLYLVRGELRHTVYSDFDVDNWYAPQPAAPPLIESGASQLHTPFIGCASSALPSLTTPP